MAILENTMMVNAQYNSTGIDAVSTVSVTLGNMNLLKTADKDPWENGDLTYTVTLHNVEQTGDITQIVFTDTIDITKSRLLTDKVTINGSPAEPGTDFTYNPATGEFEIEYPDALVPGGVVTITFQVRKV